MSFDFMYPYRVIRDKWKHISYWEKQKRLIRRNLTSEFRDKARNNPKTVYLLMTPEHENIGDHAIALAETTLFEKLGIDYVEVTGGLLEILDGLGILSIFNGKPIVMQGGGYLGTLWFWSEQVLRKIICSNPDSPIVMLPNTIYYESTDWGREEFEKSVPIYNGHSNFHIYAREKQSYEIMRNVYRNVKLIPDMVFSMNRTDIREPRHGCVICLRNDVEKTRSDAQEQMIRQQAAQLFGEDVRDSDMVRREWIPVSNRKQAVEEKLREFASAQLVITDRLHGMVFCAITGTPCVVVNSRSPKVLGCYEWIRELPYIHILGEECDLEKIYNAIKQSACCYDNAAMQPLYQQLGEDLTQILFRR